MIGVAISIVGDIPTSLATRVSGDTLLSGSAAASRLNSGEGPRLAFVIKHLRGLAGLAKMFTKVAHHH